MDGWGGVGVGVGGWVGGEEMMMRWQVVGVTREGEEGEGGWRVVGGEKYMYLTLSELKSYRRERERERRMAK